jgi:hypothetical protein
MIIVKFKRTQPMMNILRNTGWDILKIDDFEYTNVIDKKTKAVAAPMAQST